MTCADMAVLSKGGGLSPCPSGKVIDGALPDRVDSGALFPRREFLVFFKAYFSGGKKFKVIFIENAFIENNC